MQLPNPPWYRRWSVILAGVIGLAAVTALLGWQGLQDVATPSTTVTTRPTPDTATTPPTSLRRPATTTRPPGLLWRATDRDVRRGEGFRATGPWRIEWSFDCCNFRKFGGGNFKITGGGAFTRVQIQEFDVDGSGGQTFINGGYGRLQIDSVCEHWTVTVLAV